MAKQAGAGELRTRIYIRKTVKGTDAEGSAYEREESVFGPEDPERVWHCKWVNVYGSEAFTAMQLQVKEPATLTMRYSPRIRPDCIIFRLGDPAPYEIVSVNDVEARHRWLEVKVHRKEAAR